MIRTSQEYKQKDIDSTATCKKKDLVELFNSGIFVL